MTKEELKQYRKIGREIQLLQEQLAKRKANLRRQGNPFDAVRGSSPTFPYVLHDIPVGGDDSPDLLLPECRTDIMRLQNTIRKRQQERQRLEDYIFSIEDSELRQIFILRYMGQKLSWTEISRKFGSGNSADALRMRHDRFLIGK